MSITFKTTTEPKVSAKFIASKILRQLERSKKVLWLVPGGSAIAVAIETAKIISKYPHKNLAVSLTDELGNVIIGDVIMDLRNTKSESSPFITTFSKISLSVIIPTYFPLAVTKIISTSLDCNILTASATEEFSLAVTNCV